MKKYSLILFLMLTILSSFSFAEEAKKDLLLEGIMFDSQNRSESIVIINGELLNEGDYHHDYLIKRIKKTTIIVVNEITGTEEELQLPKVKKDDDPAEPEKPKTFIEKVLSRFAKKESVKESEKEPENEKDTKDKKK